MSETTTSRLAAAAGTISLVVNSLSTVLVSGHAPYGRWNLGSP